MADYVALPDVEALVSWHLRDASIPGVNGVHSSIPKSPVYPLIVVQRIGGTPVERRSLDRANVQVSVWANSKSEAHDIAQDARVEVLRMEGEEYGTALDDAPVAGYVSAVRDSLGLTWAPDPHTNKDRYVFSMSVFARGSELAGS